MTTSIKSTWIGSDAPFSTRLDSRRFHPSISQDEALSRLHFLADHHRGLGLLIGPSGCGKSIVLDVCARQLRQPSRQVLLTSLMGVDSEELLWKLAAGFGANPNIHASARQLWCDIDDRITANRYQRIDTVLLFDDAEEAETEALTVLARLAQIDIGDDSRFTMVLATKQNRVHLLGQRLQELCDLRVDLEPWSEEETGSFVKSALTAVDCDPDLFTQASISRLHELTGGVPRRIQQLGQLAIIAARAQDLTRIDEETLDAVQLELSAQPSRN